MYVVGDTVWIYTQVAFSDVPVEANSVSLKVFRDWVLVNSMLMQYDGSHKLYKVHLPLTAIGNYVCIASGSYQDRYFEDIVKEFFVSGILSSKIDALQTSVDSILPAVTNGFSSVVSSVSDVKSDTEEILDRLTVIEQMIQQEFADTDYNTKPF